MPRKTYDTKHNKNDITVNNNDNKNKHVLCAGSCAKS